MMKKIIAIVCAITLLMSLAACQNPSTGEASGTISTPSETAKVTTEAAPIIRNAADDNAAVNAVTDAEKSETAQKNMLSDVYVRFGQSEKFALHPYDNDTAAELIRNITSSGRQLPIYDFEGYEGADVYQYYDIPSRYDIPSAPVAVSAEKAGEVYYSAPNRLMLFFGDGQISGDLTKVGYFDDTEAFRSAVKNNPQVPGWGNLLVIITLD